MSVHDLRTPVLATSIGVALIFFSSSYAAEIDVTVKIGLCGDGIIDTTEECDGATLGGATCVTEGFASGDLQCGLSCEFDTSACTASVPGPSVSGGGGGGGGGNGGGSRPNPIGNAKGALDQGQTAPALTAVTTLASTFSKIVEIVSALVLTEQQNVPAVTTVDVVSQGGGAADTSLPVRDTSDSTHMAPASEELDKARNETVVQAAVMQNVIEGLRTILSQLQDFIVSMLGRMRSVPLTGSQALLNVPSQALLSAVTVPQEGPRSTEVVSTQSATVRESVGMRIVRYVTQFVRRALFPLSW